MKLKKAFVFSTLIIISAFINCTDYKRVSEDQFIGIWQLEGRSMFDGIIIEVKRDERGKLIGHIKQLNDNKYIKMFANEGDIWVSDISRNSNYQFKITEKKIARELFGLYGLSSSSEFSAEFIDKNTIGVSGNGNPLESSIKYIRLTATQAKN